MSCHGQDVHFEVQFSAISTTVWWLLFVAASTVWFYHRHNKSKSARLYKFLYTVITLNAISEAVYLGWIQQIANHHSAQGTYYFFILIDKLALSSFVALMLVCAAGYCITRDDLGPHTFRALSVPIIWLVTGWITGFVWYATQDSPDDWCTTHLKMMTSAQATVWFVCSVINLATYLMAWVYIFSIMGEEMEMLDTAEKLLMEKCSGDAEAVRMESEASERIVRSLLGPQGATSHLDPPPPPTELDVEAARELDTFAGRVDFMLKKKLLYRFALGCGAYLFALICVLLIPIFNVDVLETTLYALEATVKWLFVASLIYILRPTTTNPYLSLDVTSGPDVTTQLTFFDDDDDDADGAAAASQPQSSAGSGGLLGNGAAATCTHRAPGKEVAVAMVDVAGRRDQRGGAAAGSGSPQETLEEHKKKFSLDDEEEDMQEIGLSKHAARA